MRVLARQHARAFHQRVPPGLLCTSTSKPAALQPRHRLVQMLRGRASRSPPRAARPWPAGPRTCAGGRPRRCWRRPRPAGWRPWPACPGRSTRSMASWVRRPSRASSRVSTLASSRVSMLPPHSTRPTVRPLNRSGCAQHGRQAGRARALDHGLLDVDQQAHGVLDLLLGDQHDVVDQLAHDRLCVIAARRLDGDALGQRVAAHRQAARP